MSTYNFKTSKPSFFGLTLFFSLIGGGGLLIGLDSMLSIFHKGNTFYFILSYVGLVILLSIYLTRLTSFAKVEITLDNDTISIKWLSQFLFHNKPDVKYSFNEIAAYIDHNDYYWDWLKIEMTDGSIYKLWHSTFLFKDDYSEFVSAFSASVKDYNNAINKSSTKDNLTAKPEAIKRAKSIYEGTKGLILAGIAIVVIIGLPILLFVVPSSKEPNYFLFSIGYFGAIYYLIQIYTLRKKNKMNDKQ